MARWATAKPMSDAPRGPSRRAVLGGGVAAVGGGVAGYFGRFAREEGAFSSGEPAPPEWREVADSRVIAEQVEPFYGARQAGIVTPPQTHAAFVAFDLDDDVRRPEVEGVLRTWTQDSARLTRGVGGLADQQHELAENPARLTVTIGVGAGLFDKLDLSDRRPSWLAPLPAFPEIDQLEDRWSGGDLVLQIRSDDELTVAHASRVLSSAVRGAAGVRWVQRGFRRPVGSDPQGRTQRNLFGQLDGTVNPHPDTDSDFDSLLFSDGSDQRWMRGGSSLVLRRIRMQMDTWEMVDRLSREHSIGRTLDTGAPLTGNSEHDAPDFEATNEVGLPVIPPQSHMARAFPEERAETMLRRPYNYDESPPPGQVSDSGLLFAAYVADPVRQFVPVQRRLAEADMLNEWTVPVGSAVFALPPGAREGGFVGEGLFAAAGLGRARG